MTHEIASVRTAGRTLVASLVFGLALTAGFALVLPGDAQAQQQPAKPAQKPAQPAKPAQKPAQPAQQQQPAPQQGAAANGADQQPHLMYSPWIKICNKNQQDPKAKQVCVTAKDGRLENGMPVAAIALIEPEGADKKLIRVTVPLGMQLQHGTRMIVDQEQPLTAPYFMCFPNGCMADYEATNEVIGKLKKGKQITIQAINMNGTPISLPLPLVDFAKAHDGPPTDPKVFEEQQRKLQEELQKKAEEARKKLEAQPPAAAPKQ